MDAIKKNNQLKIKKKDDKTKSIVYLNERLDRLVKLYPSSFDDKSLNILGKLVINEKKNDCKSLSYKILFYDEDNVRSHEINFVEKYGMTVCSYHVTYGFQSESTLYSCLNVKELLARNRREI